MSKELKVGDLVTVNDDSWAVRIDSQEEHVSIGLSEDIFKIIKVTYRDVICVTNIRDIRIHNIHIQNISNGNIYLHSKCMVTLIPKPVKEVTLADLEEKYGCVVKIVK